MYRWLKPWETLLEIGFQNILDTIHGRFYYKTVKKLIYQQHKS